MALARPHFGKIAENVVASHLETPAYWRKGNKEVDFIMEEKIGATAQPVHIEVKQSNSITNKDLKGLYRFMDQNDSEKGIVITDDLEKTDGRIHYVPLWKWLLDTNPPAFDQPVL